jgi:hypothetical protein
MSVSDDAGIGEDLSGRSAADVANHFIVLSTAIAGNGLDWPSTALHHSRLSDIPSTEFRCDDGFV